MEKTAIKSAGLSADLIITDIKMPIADGLQMMTKLRENCFETEFILLTGYAEFEYAQRRFSWS
ncbi:MAG: response regulator [[Clostridium] leptum]